MKVAITWIDAPNHFAQSPPTQRRGELRTMLDLTYGEAIAAATFPLKPDGSLTVLTLNTSVTEDGFVYFSPEFLRRFEELAKELVAELTPEDNAHLNEAIGTHNEVGAAYGASEEGVGVVVRTERVGYAKERIEGIFGEVEALG